MLFFFFSPTVTSQRLLQQACELRVTKGYVRTVLAERPNHPAERVQRHVNAVGLLTPLSLHPGFARPLRPRQVNEGESGGHLAVAHDVSLCAMHQNGVVWCGVMWLEEGRIGGACEGGKRGGDNRTEQEGESKNNEKKTKVRQQGRLCIYIYTWYLGRKAGRQAGTAGTAHKLEEAVRQADRLTQTETD